MARKTGQIVGRGARRWLVRVFLGRDRDSRRRRYHNRTVHGTARRAQEYLTKMLRERDLGRRLEGSEIALNGISRSLVGDSCQTKLREKSYRSYESLLHFLRDASGNRPVYGGTKKFQEDPHWKDYILFYEYFHGDNGAGLGASHQTGWTGIIARVLDLFARGSAADWLQTSKGDLGARMTREQVAGVQKEG